MTVSAAGTVLAYNALSPKYADVGQGHAYAIVLANQTNADVTTGSFTVEGADPDPNDPCIPGTFAPLQVEPECSPPLGASAPNATITIDAQNPIKAFSQCAFAVACPKPFVRVAGTAGTLDVLAVVTRLKRTGM
jgi:hypothetical protein